MVSIDMEIPSCCMNCGLLGKEEMYCSLYPRRDLDVITVATNRPNWCPLVEIEERKVGKCTDCKEYNQAKHYCPKFCDVIRDTTKEMQEFYKGEHEKLERIEQIVDSRHSWFTIPELELIREVLNG